MEQWLSANEPGVRQGFFFGILVLMALWEVLRPRRAGLQTRERGGGVPTARPDDNR